jgi:hypothetical protein
MGRRGGQTEVPGEQVPGDRADDAGEDDAQASQARGRLTRPSPTVLATFAPKWAPTKLPTAAISSATPGVRARVEIEVAIALAASWKPLV